MKLILLFCLVVLSVQCAGLDSAAANSPSSASPQTGVTVTEKIEKYKRKGEDIPEGREYIEVRTPVVNGIKDPEVAQKVREAIDFEKVFGFKIDDADLEGDWHGLSEVDYKVFHVDDSLLSIELYSGWLGAYLTEDIKRLVVDLRTGETLGIRDVFKDLDGLAEMIDAAQQKEIEEKAKELKKEDPELPAILLEQVGDTRFSVNDLGEFSVTQFGVTFFYQYEFVPPARGLQPDGKYFFEWAKVASYVKPEGALAALSRTSTMRIK